MENWLNGSQSKIHKTAILNHTKDEMFNVADVREPSAMTVVRLVLFGVLFLVAAIGNIVVFTAPFRHQNLRTFSYYLITALAISDFISVLGMPLIVASGELDSGWIFGEALCRGLNPTQIICSMVTTNVHTVISIDRHRAIMNPFRIKPNGRQTIIIMALNVLFSLICALPAFGARKLISVPAPNGKVFHCIESFPVRPYFYQRLYTIFLFVVNYFLPITIMFCLYTRVVIKLRNSEIRKHRAKSTEISSSANVSTREKSVPSKPQGLRRASCLNCSTSTTGYSSLRKKPSRYTVAEKNFIKMIFLVLAIFIVCYLPYQIFFLLIDFAYELIDNWKYKFIVHKVFFFITWIPNAINPVCYNAMDRYYKRAFKAILSFCR